MTEDNTILVVAVLAVIASLAAAGFSYYSLSQGPKIAGFAGTEYGYTNLTIQNTASINFSTNFINFGTGIVNYSGTVMNSEGLYGANVSGFSNVTQPLVLENIGNQNVSLTLSSSTAATFLGGTSPSYMLKVTNKDAGACNGPNMTSYTEVTGASQAACDKFGFDNSYDEIEIDVQLYVPYNIAFGEHTATITATGTGLL